MHDNAETILKFEVPEIIYGVGSLSHIGNCAARLGGDRVLLVTDPGIVNAGWIDETVKHIERENLKYVVYDNVVSNPRDFQVEQGVQLYRQKRCDVIVAVGGGSPIDAAKGIAILAANHGSIGDYEGCNLVSQPIPPLVCAPTTAGTGSDVSQFAVICDTIKKLKMTILSRAIMPDISVIDPRLLQTKTSELMAATGMDALTHAIEAYVSSLSWSMTDPHAYHAIELVSTHLRKAVKTKDIEALKGMSIACLEAGIAFSNAILGAVHALAHPLGSLYDIHHGVANAILLPKVVEKNIPFAEKKFSKIAAALGLDAGCGRTKDLAPRIPEFLDDMIADIGLPTRLSEIGVRREDIPVLAVMAQEDICMLTNPYQYDKTEIESIYRDIW